MTLDEIKRLIEFIREQDLTEFELEHDGMKLRIKSGTVTHTSVPLMPAVSVIAAPPVATAPPVVNHTPASAPAAAEESVPEEGDELAIVKSPIVGNFYRAPEPTAKNFVEVGDTVKKGQVLCIIEAMKLMNEIESKVGGRIARILVENGQAVEYGQPLFLVDPQS